MEPGPTRRLSKREKEALSPADRRELASHGHLGRHTPHDVTKGVPFDGAVLKARRKAAGLTQLQLADQLGVGERTLRRWERGIEASREPFRWARRLAEALGGEPADYRL